MRLSGVGYPARRLYLSTDRQDYMVNWSRDADRRNLVLHAVGTADNTSGYVFGMHLSFDRKHDPTAIETDAKATGDIALPYPHRKHAWLWLLADYAEAQAAVTAEKTRKAAKAAKGPPGGKLSDVIADARKPIRSAHPPDGIWRQLPLETA